jgi:CTP:molybdopterin cytidylyltransferase MocA
VQADPVNAAPPQVTLQTPGTVTTGSEVRIPVTAYDPDGNPVRLRAETLPQGARLDGDVIVWKPRTSGDQSVVVVGDDGHDITRTAVTVTVT